MPDGASACSAYFGGAHTSPDAPGLTGPPCGGSEMFLSSCTTTGAKLFEIVFADIMDGADVGERLVIDASGEMIVTGSYQGIFDLCGVVLSGLNDSRGLIARFRTPDPVAVPEAAIAGLLRQNHPNPFSPMTTIRHQLATPGPVTLDVGSRRKSRSMVLVR